MVLRLLRPPLFIALLALGALDACGGRGVDDVALAPTLAVNPRVQLELRRLEEAWEAAANRERQALRPHLESFIRRHPNDPGTHRARVLLAWIQLESDDLDEAERTLAPALEASGGATHDHARLVQAAILTRRQRPDEALGILEPLHGKLVGQEVNRRYGRERVRAALEARRWRLLVAAMTQSLEEGSANQARLQQSVRANLAQVPSHALLRLLDEQRSGPARKRDSERWMERAMTEQLADAALKTGDARLARQLLEVAASWLRTSPRGDQLVLLAREGAREARIEGRTLGVVIEAETSVGRRRSAEVVAGIIDALGLGRATSDASVRLLVRESRNKTAATLAALASEGASVLIAGVSDLDALVALAFAEERQVPVMVLTDPPHRPPQLEYGFVLGPQAVAERALLESHMMTRGIERPILIGAEPDAGCTTRPSLEAKFPFTTWQQEGHTGVILLGDAACARRLAADLRRAPSPFVVGLGLDASSALQETAPTITVGLGAGSYPRAGATSWYELLGRDAARLAQAALAVVPEDTDVDGEAVRMHLERARDALRSAKAELETTHVDGFRGKQVLSRRLRVIEVDAASAPETTP